MIEIRIDSLLKSHGRTFYWLAKQTSISHTTLWRLKKGKAFGINFDTLEKLCQALVCQPGDVLSVTNGKRSLKRVAQEDGRRSNHHGSEIGTLDKPKRRLK